MFHSYKMAISDLFADYNQKEIIRKQHSNSSWFWQNPKKKFEIF
jgi:hypothetical protein